MDDFGIKYVDREHINHLLVAIKKDYTIAEDWEGKLYCGVSVEWNYKEKWVDISVRRYIKRHWQDSNTKHHKKRNTNLSDVPPRNMERQHKNRSHQMILPRQTTKV